MQATEVVLADAAPHGGTSIAAAAADLRIWLWAVVWLCFNCGLSATVVWLPQIIRAASVGSTLTVGLLSAIPPVCSTAAMLLWGRHSRRVDEQQWHVALPMIVGGIGVACVGYAHGLAPSVAAVTVAIIATASQPPLFALVSSLSAGRQNAAGIAIVNAIGVCGSFVGPYLFGYGVEHLETNVVVFAAFGCVLSLGGVLALLVPQNRRLTHRAQPARAGVASPSM
jgi:MFS-type transporter involved in bile tolerance (Atg22 family)